MKTALTLLAALISLATSSDALAEKFGCYAIQGDDGALTVDFSNQKVLFDFKQRTGRFKLLKGDSSAPMLLGSQMDYETDANGKSVWFVKLVGYIEQGVSFELNLIADPSVDIIPSRYGDYVRVTYLRDSDLVETCALFSQDFTQLKGIYSTL